MITLVIAEDHRLVREGLRGILQTDPQLTVVGEASNGMEALEVIRSAKPNVVILDLSLPRMHGLEVLARLQKQKRTRAIVVTMHGDMPSLIEALRLGAHGFVLKDTPSSELIEAIKTVSAGKKHVCRSLEPQLRKALLKDWGKVQLPSTADSLTARERLVLEKVAAGLSSENAAAELGIAPATVAKHRCNLMRKIGAKTPIDAVRYAVRNGLISL